MIARVSTADITCVSNGDTAVFHWAIDIQSKYTKVLDIKATRVIPPHQSVGIYYQKRNVVKIKQLFFNLIPNYCFMSQTVATYAWVVITNHIHWFLLNYWLIHCQECFVKWQSMFVNSLWKFNLMSHWFPEGLIACTDFPINTHDGVQWPIYPCGFPLTHWGRDKMDAILQTTCSSAFSWMKMFKFRLKFHWSLFLKVQLTCTNPALFQITAWRRPGDTPLSEPMMVSSLMHICVTQPQWVNWSQPIDSKIQLLQCHLSCGHHS